MLPQVDRSQERRREEMPEMPNETEVKREEGWYWIRQVPDWDWEVGRFHDGTWTHCGDDRELDPSEILTIGPRCINPIEKPLDAAADLLISNAIVDMIRSPEFKAEMAAAVEKAKAAGTPDGN